MAVAVTSLENAKAEADRQQLYLEVVSQPSVPDMAQLPTDLQHYCDIDYRPDCVWHSQPVDSQCS